MNVKLLTEQHLEFLSLKGGCTGWSESTHVKMPHFWKSHATAHLIVVILILMIINAHTLDNQLHIPEQTSLNPYQTVSGHSDHGLHSQD